MTTTPPVPSVTSAVCQWEAFNLPPELHYLNCAFMSPLPRVVEEAGVRGIMRKRNPALLAPDDFFQASEELRVLFGQLIGAPNANSVAILPAVSYGVGVVARNTPLRNGQNVVLPSEQFPGNVYGWRRLAWDRGAEVRMVSPEAGAARGRIWNEKILEAIDVDTGVVAVAPVHWTDGTRFDLEAIGARAREVGAALVVDGTQAVGALPFDVARVRPDALIVAAYKWLLGPYSIGVGYFGDRYLDGFPLEETWIAREGSEDFRRLVEYRDEYQPGAVRFDVGERSNFILLPMLLEALRLVLAWEPEGIQEYTRRLVAPLIELAQELGYGVEEEGYRAGHIFGIRAPAGVAMERVAAALAAEEVSASIRGTALRVSPHLYNREEDMEALGRALRSAVEP